MTGSVFLNDRPKHPPVGDLQGTDISGSVVNVKTAKRFFSKAKSLKWRVADYRYSFNMPFLWIEIIRSMMLNNSVIPHHDRVNFPLDSALYRGVKYCSLENVQ